MLVAPCVVSLSAVVKRTRLSVMFASQRFWSRLWWGQEPGSSLHVCRMPLGAGGDLSCPFGLRQREPVTKASIIRLVRNVWRLAHSGHTKFVAESVCSETGDVIMRLLRRSRRYRIALLPSCRAGGRHAGQSSSAPPWRATPFVAADTASGPSGSVDSHSRGGRTHRQAITTARRLGERRAHDACNVVQVAHAQLARYPSLPHIRHDGLAGGC